MVLSIDCDEIEIEWKQNKLRTERAVDVYLRKNQNDLPIWPITRADDKQKFHFISCYAIAQQEYMKKNYRPEVFAITNKKKWNTKK